MLRVVWDSWTRDEIAAELCRARAGQCLRILDITLCDAHDLSDVFRIAARCGSLTEIRVRGSFATLPASVGNLVSVKHLILISFSLGTLPDIIGQLHALVSLDITCSAVTVLPETIGLIRTLEILLVQNKRLQRLPDSVGDLTALKCLSIRWCPVTTLPTSLGQLRNLKILDIRETRIRHLPVSVCQLSALDSLRASLCTSGGVGLSFPPAHVVTKGAAAVKDYLFQFFLPAQVLALVILARRSNLAHLPDEMWNDVLSECRDDAGMLNEMISM